MCVQIHVHTYGIVNHHGSLVKLHVYTYISHYISVVYVRMELLIHVMVDNMPGH